MTAPMVDAIPMNRVSQNSPDEQVFVQPGPYPEEETQSHSHSQISVELEEAIEESSSQRAPEGLLIEWMGNIVMMRVSNFCKEGCKQACQK